MMDMTGLSHFGEEEEEDLTGVCLRKIELRDEYVRKRVVGQELLRSSHWACLFTL